MTCFADNAPSSVWINIERLMSTDVLKWPCARTGSCCTIRDSRTAALEWSVLRYTACFCRAGGRLRTSIRSGLTIQLQQTYNSIEIIQNIWDRMSTESIPKNWTLRIEAFLWTVSQHLQTPEVHSKAVLGTIRCCLFNDHCHLN